MQGRGTLFGLVVLILLRTWRENGLPESNVEMTSAHVFLKMLFIHR